jgi:ADP-ribosyl-[dinitrogen reductase] hydrolase
MTAGSLVDPERPWRRDLDDDLDVVAFWGAKGVMTLIEEREILALGVGQRGQFPALAAGVLARSMTWYHLPVPPRSIPDLVTLVGLEYVADEWDSRMAAGERLMIHSRRGLGRAGMVAAVMLVRWGMEPEAAMEKVRKACGARAIETLDQEKIVGFVKARRLSARGGL